MNWAIHTKGPTPASDLKAALEAERDALLGSESIEAARQASLAQLAAAVVGMPPGEARDALVAARSKLDAEPAAGISDAATRASIAAQADAGIAAACAIASGPVNVTVSGCAGRVDEDTLGRMSVQIDFVDLKGMAARLAREAGPEPVVTEGSVSAPPV